MVLWHLWIGRARHPGPGFAFFLIEVLNVGEWPTHCDFALDARVDFLAVVEHRLIPARVRIEWARLRCKRLASIWAPASQEASFVGHAGGVVCRSCWSWGLPSIAFFDCGRAVRCVLPLGGGRVMHLVVLYGYQGADRDSERLALTDQLLSELGVVAREQPCLLVGDFNVVPTKIPCLAKGIMAGLWVVLEASWACASGKVPGLPAGKIGDLPMGLVVNSWWVALVLLLLSLVVRLCEIVGWCLTLLFVRVLIILCGWRGFLCLFNVRLCGRPLGCRFLIRVGGPRLPRFRGFGISVMIGYSFMSRDDALDLDGSLANGDVSLAWMIWSSAVEAALADAYRFAGGPVPDSGLVLGRVFFGLVL